MTAHADPSAVASHDVNCDPLWYYAANLLGPRDIGSTKRRGWIEGFVAALEVLAAGGEDGETLLETLHVNTCTIACNAHCQGITAV